MRGHKAILEYLFNLSLFSRLKLFKKEIIPTKTCNFITELEIAAYGSAEFEIGHCDLNIHYIDLDVLPVRRE